MHAPRLLALPLALGCSFLPVPALQGWRGEWPVFFILFAAGACYHFYRFLRRSANPELDADAGGFHGREMTELLVSSLWAGLMVLTFWVSILLVEHNLKVAMSLADRVYLMGKAHLGFTGTKEELAAQPNIRAKYLEV